MAQKVYISSTVRDLQDYRNATASALYEMGLTTLMGEDFVPHSGDYSALEWMHQRVQEADFFVGIYAWNYGGIPVNDLNGQPNSAGKSYIEMEYEWASARKIPCRLFFIADQMPWPAEHYHDPDGKLKQLKDRMMSERGVDFFGSKDELVIQALKRIGSLSRVPDNAIAVRPIFAPPSAAPQFQCDVFMVMPFAPAFQPIYDDSIKPVIEKRLKLSIRRGDDFFASQSIMQDIWSAMSACKLVIADCTGKNPNVFYELGMAHTLGKPTITITQNIDDIPFDIRHLRHIVYAYTPPGMKAFEKALREAVANLLG